MPSKPAGRSDVQALRKIAASRGQERYILRLYVVDTSPRSMRAVVNARKICEEHLHGRYELEVIDVSRHPTLAAGEQIIAAPTLIKKLPLPLRRFIGDLSQTERILLGLDLRPTDGKQPPTRDL